MWKNSRTNDGDSDIKQKPLQSNCEIPLPPPRPSHTHIHLNTNKRRCFNRTLLLFEMYHLKYTETQNNSIKTNFYTDIFGFIKVVLHNR